VKVPCLRSERKAFTLESAGLACPFAIQHRRWDHLQGKVFVEYLSGSSSSSAFRAKSSRKQLRKSRLTSAFLAPSLRGNSSEFLPSEALAAPVASWS